MVPAHRPYRDDPREGCRVGIPGRPARRGAVVPRRRHHHHAAGDRVADGRTHRPRGAGRAKRHVDHRHAMADRVPDSAGDRGFVMIVRVVDGETRLVVVKDDPDRQNPRRRRDPDHPAGPPWPGPVAGDQRGDEGAVRVRRPVAGRIGGPGEVRPGRHRAAEVRHRLVDARVEYPDGDAPSPGHPPGGRHPDGRKLRQVAGPGLLAGALGRPACWRSGRPGGSERHDDGGRRERRYAAESGAGAGAGRGRG